MEQSSLSLLKNRIFPDRQAKSYASTLQALGNICSELYFIISKYYFQKLLKHLKFISEWPKLCDLSITLSQKIIKCIRLSPTRHVKQYNVVSLYDPIPFYIYFLMKWEVYCWHQGDAINTKVKSQLQYSNPVVSLPMIKDSCYHQLQ